MSMSLPCSIRMQISIIQQIRSGLGISLSFFIFLNKRTLLFYCYTTLALNPTNYKFSLLAFVLVLLKIIRYYIWLMIPFLSYQPLEGYLMIEALPIDHVFQKSPQVTIIRQLIKF